jgi:hypothetical protein
MVSLVLLTYLISWSFVIPTDGGLISYGPMITYSSCWPWLMTAAASLTSGNK